MTGPVAERAYQKAFGIASSFRGRLKLGRWISSSGAAFGEDQAFVGGSDDVRLPSSTITSRGQNLVQTWNDQDAHLSVDQNQIRRLLKANIHPFLQLNVHLHWP